MWSEVLIARKENKRELNLQGVAIAERLQPDGSGLDAQIFTLSSLNLLNISDTGCLQLLPSALSNLTNLQTLMLYGNRLQELPASIGQLDKLKVLDVSRNQLTALPAELAQLQHLFSVNLSQNKLTAIPALSRCTKLSVLDVSSNELSAFPDVCREALANLSEVNVKGNRIAEIPAEIVQLAALKVLAMEGNDLRAVPKALAAMPKLKEVYLKDNPIDKTDKRLHKLILQCTTKQILAHVAKHGTVAPKKSATPAGAAAAAAVEATPADEVADTDALPTAVAAVVPLPTGSGVHLLRIQRHQDDTVRVVLAEAIKDVRPHLLCCVVRNVCLADGRLQKFLQLQNRLHESVCGHREKATIATHDYAAVLARGAITYTAESPRRLKIVPLGKTRAVSGEEFFKSLRNEAEQMRREKRRNTFSGIHRYLYLVEKLPRFACLQSEATGEVISLPPLTNSEGTKIGEQTRDVFVEVTSSSSMPDCKAAMEELLLRMVTDGFGQPVDAANTGADEEVDDEGRPFVSRMYVQQVRCTDVAGNLRRVYPAKTDLERLPATVVVRRDA